MTVACSLMVHRGNEEGEEEAGVEGGRARENDGALGEKCTIIGTVIV